MEEGNTFAEDLILGQNKSTRLINPNAFRLIDSTSVQMPHPLVLSMVLLMDNWGMPT